MSLQNTEQSDYTYNLLLKSLENIFIFQYRGF
jgi:hypothetical protein